MSTFVECLSGSESFHEIAFQLFNMNFQRLCNKVKDANGNLNAGGKQQQQILGNGITMDI